MMTTDSAFEAWKQRAGRVSIQDVAERLGANLKGITRVERVGPCPRCGGTDRFSINTRKSVFYCRAAGTGGDVIAMVMYVLDMDFLRACEFVLGEPPPDRDTKLTDDDRERFARLAEEQKRRDAQRAVEDNEFREIERGRLYDIWCQAEAAAGELADYLALRLGPSIHDVPRTEWPRLRLVRDMPYYQHNGDRGEVLTRAPAMIAPIVDAAGKFKGLHFTYIDFSAPKGKLCIPNPKRQGELLPAKKARGSKQGNRIELFARGEDCAPATQLIFGEGIEKTLAVWLALRLAGRDLAATLFWTCSDWTNLGGRSVKSVRHPFRRHEISGLPVRVGGPEPDLTVPAIVVPETIEDLVLLGDSTSDRFTTECVLARATRRYARDGRTVRVAWAPDGVDFDEVLLRDAA